MSECKGQGQWEEEMYEWVRHDITFFLPFSPSLDFSFTLLVVCISHESSKAVAQVYWIMEPVKSKAGNQVRLIKGKK